MRWLSFRSTKKQILFCGLLAVLGTNVRAEPAPVTQFLMQTPVNAFDFGLVQLDQRFTMLDRIYPPMNRPGRMDAVANYDPQRHRIVVAANVFVSTSAMALDDARAVCRFAVADARFYGGVDPNTGDRLPKEIRSVAMFFQSRSTARESEPDNFERDLMSIIDFDIAVYSNHTRTGKVDKKISCFAPLLGTEIRFSEE